jgi:hypothetical protein
MTYEQAEEVQKALIALDQQIENASIVEGVAATTWSLMRQLAAIAKHHRQPLLRRPPLL